MEAPRRWLASERVFRAIPFVLVEALFVLTILVPFALTIWISLLKWRANRPFETARFAGLGALYGLFRADAWSGVDHSDGPGAQDSAALAELDHLDVQGPSRAVPPSG